MSSFRVVYLGGKQVGCVGLLSLYAGSCRVQGVVAYDNSVRVLAQSLDLPVVDSIHKPSVYKWFQDSDLLVCVHGREIVPKGLLSLPRDGGINVHPCLYAYKGSHPIERLLLDHNHQASVGVHRMTEDVDGGEVLMEEFVDVSGLREVQEIYQVLYPWYAVVLIKVLKQLCN